MGGQRNPALAALEVFLGDWRQTVSEASFLDDPAATISGGATFEFLDDAFVVLRSRMEGGPPHSVSVIGRNESEPGYSVLYYDERGVSRVYAMTFEAGEWTLLREDPDFYQRFVGRVSDRRIEGSWQQSHDRGATWEHDFTLVYER